MKDPAPDDIPAHPTRRLDLTRLKPSGSRIRPGFFYNRLIPVVLIGLGLLTTLLILIAAGVLFGLIPYR